MNSKILLLGLVVCLSSCATTKTRNFCNTLDKAVETQDNDLGIRTLKARLTEISPHSTENEKARFLFKEIKKCGYDIYNGD